MRWDDGPFGPKIAAVGDLGAMAFWLWRANSSDNKALISGLKQSANGQWL